MEQNELLARIDRLESTEAIRQLASKYSLSLDMRDLDAHVGLFAPDIRVGRGKTGKAELKAWVEDTLRHQFTGTSHHIGQHIIEFTDPDHATAAGWLFERYAAWCPDAQNSGTLRSCYE